MTDLYYLATWAATHRLRRNPSPLIYGGLIQLRKQLIKVAEDHGHHVPHTYAARNNILMQSWCWGSCWCQCFVTQPEPSSPSSSPAVATTRFHQTCFSDFVQLHVSRRNSQFRLFFYIHRNRKAYWGRVNGGGARRRLYTYRYTVTSRMTPALRWAAMRGILMFH